MENNFYKNKYPGEVKNRNSTIGVSLRLQEAGRCYPLSLFLNKGIKATILRPLQGLIVRMHPFIAIIWDVTG
jgi:hypothetical protein